MVDKRTNQNGKVQVGVVGNTCGNGGGTNVRRLLIVLAPFLDSTFHLRLCPVFGVHYTAGGAVRFGGF